MSLLTPGIIVINPVQPDWGRGQVQSNVHGKLTVNFENVGKVVIDSNVVDLIPVFEDE